MRSEKEGGAYPARDRLAVELLVAGRLVTCAVNQLPSVREQPRHCATKEEGEKRGARERGDGTARQSEKERERRHGAGSEGGREGSGGRESERERETEEGDGRSGEEE